MYITKANCFLIVNKYIKMYFIFIFTYLFDFKYTTNTLTYLCT